VKPFRSLLAGATVVALILVSLGAPPAEAQQEPGVVTGTVVDATTGEPLRGAQVVVRGTQRGALTDGDGGFRITGVPAGAHNVDVTTIGYARGTQAVTLAAGGTAELAFQLRQTAVDVAGVVVTGTGTAVERRELSADVGVLSSRQIEEAPVTDISQLLQGRVSGATVRAQSAQPGQASNINFRGISSVFASQTPVIYVDGVRVDNSSGRGFDIGGEVTSSLADILTTDIERIEITKGGAASTLYGSEAAAGVIQIFTRRGIAGAPRITARMEQGLDVPETKFIQDAGFAYPFLEDEPDFNPNFVRDEFLRTGHFQNYYLGVTGGTEAATYNVSGRMQHSEGVQPKNDGTLFTLRGAMDANVRDDLSLDFSGSYTRNNFNRLFSGVAISDPLTALEVGDILFFSGQSNLRDALDVYLLPEIGEAVNRITFSSTANYTPNPLFTSRATVGVDFRANEQRILEPIDFVVTGDEGRVDRFNRDFSSVTLDLAGTFRYPREGPVTSRFTIGAQGFREDDSAMWGTGRGYSLPGFGHFGTAADITANESTSQIFNGGIYLLENLGLWDRLFLEAGVRFDWNSAFGETVGFETYPKAGLAYNISDEDFWQPTIGRFVDVLKLRAAYGATGTFPPAFERDATLVASPFRGESAPRFDNPGNPDLRPERVATLELGFDAGILDDRVGLTFTWYDATTTDALFFVPEQPATGLTTQMRNIGEINNRGVELGVNANLVRTPRVTWNVNATYNAVRNEVTDMGGQEAFNIDAGRRVDEGMPVGAYYMNHPLDTTGDGLLDGIALDWIRHPDTDEILIPFPDRTGSIGTDVTLFRNLRLSALGDWSRGASIIDYGTAWATFNALDRIDFPTRHDADGEPLRTYSYTEAFNYLLMDGNFFKLRELSARYGVPANLIGRLPVERASVYLTARNVAIFTPSHQPIFADEARPNLIDPELVGVSSPGQLQVGGAQSITLSPPRQFRLGIEVGF
jgi:TonB-dependent starch-binding outer membrane protein SusC